MVYQVLRNGAFFLRKGQAAELERILNSQAFPIDIYLYKDNLFISIGESLPPEVKSDIDRILEVNKLVLFER
ncbi:MAG: hypothetical protein QNJ54_12890 [Prochloraceae cyanobacterium]|nr:hypothetical protein [Prochloraceae cyanobacterium]